MQGTKTAAMATELRLTCQECDGTNVRPLPYSMVEPDQCEHCGSWFRTRFSVALHRAEYLLTQSKWGSFIEACANTAAGYLLALVCMNIIMWAYDFQVTPSQTTVIVSWMTVVSIIRGYVIRRLWNKQFWRRKPKLKEEPCVEMGALYCNHQRTPQCGTDRSFYGPQ